MVQDVIPNLITDRINNMLTFLPTMDEVHNAIFSLNNDSAPGPDGFGAIFFQTYWEIIKQDVYKVVMQFFTTGWLLPNFNTNILLLIPKTNNADLVDQYRPIVIANFKFKIISKTLVDRLAKIMPAITSVQQRGFIKGMSIKDCICLTSEAINVLHKKSFGGNLSLKVDIAKAFDTLDWKFLIEVLEAFGFNYMFCKWIKNILSSAKISIAINGKLHGFFSCTRGVRQGDPLSPLLFCLVEEVMSRSITKMVREGHLKLIIGSRDNLVPSHILYADDIMIFCKGINSNIQNLTDLFIKYAQVSGQCVNPAKSSILGGAISNYRLSSIATQIGFKIGSLPFTYHGVPIFKGKPKISYFQPLADRIKLKFSAWKTSLLSMVGRVQLVKSVIQSMLLHSISVYSFPVKLIKDIERWMRNFVWSGDVNQRKLVTVSWHKVFLPLKEGGLGIRSMSKINEGANLKLCWELIHSNYQWAHFLKSRVMKMKKPISYHVLSSIWSGIKHKYSEVLLNSSWNLGDGVNINFWTDNWCGKPLVEEYSIDPGLHENLSSTVNLFIKDAKWKIPQPLIQNFPNIQNIVETITIPVIAKDDELLWNLSSNGELSFKDAYLFHCNHGQNIAWAKLIWNKNIPPSKSLIIWRSLHNKLPTDDILSFRGCQLPSMCSLCNIQGETFQHMFFECNMAREIWHWLCSKLDTLCNFSTITEALDICNRQSSPLCKLVVLTAVVYGFNIIWYCRNQKKV